MKAELLLGASVTPAQDAAKLDRDVLTTHGVILGMTGSGKTGMAVIILEELARARVPLLICDLKGDMTNMLLNFPRLTPEEFGPWVPAADAGSDRGAAATAVAARWRDGLAKWSLGEAEILQVREGVEWSVLTPGSGLAPVDILPALEPPPGYDPDLDPDGARSRLDGAAAGLLALVERGGDPLADRDHVLLATLLDASWRQQRPLDLAGLIRQLADPPVARFGVLDAEAFYPRKERQELVRAFNTVLASPAFAVWTRGTPLVIERLIGTSGAPRASILYLAHLGDRERLSFLTLLFSALLSWTRAQPGSEALRVLLYLDEVQGIIPPTAAPPTKAPLLTLLKQGRAFGSGVLLATQNPVDLDYKALGNAGLKLVGRLDTENDRRRALEGLDVTGAEIDATVAGLKPRQFVMAGARIGAPRVVSSRWAMSYLRGPLTLAELKPLVGVPAAATAATAAAAPVVPLLSGVEQLFLPGERLLPHVMVEGEVVYRKAQPAIERRVAGRWFVPFDGERVAWERARVLERGEMMRSLPLGAALAPLPASASAALEEAPRGFAAELDSRALEVLYQRDLRLLQEEGETRESFEARVAAALAAVGDPKVETVRRRYEEKLARVDDKLARERTELARDEEDLAARKRQGTLTLAAGVGETLLSGLGALLGGRRRSISGAVRRGTSAARAYSEKQRMAGRAEAEVVESRQSIEALEAERARLTAELERELEVLRSQRSGAGELLRLTPARKDITVRRVALAWMAEDRGA